MSAELRCGNCGSDVGLVMSVFGRDYCPVCSPPRKVSTPRRVWRWLLREEEVPNWLFWLLLLNAFVGFITGVAGWFFA